MSISGTLLKALAMSDVLIDIYKRVHIRVHVFMGARVCAVALAPATSHALFDLQMHRGDKRQYIYFHCFATASGRSLKPRLDNERAPN